MRAFLLLILLGAGFVPGWSKAPAPAPLRPSFRMLGVEHGLSSPALLTVAQDAQGILWVGGESGLFLFDGHRFHPVPLPVRERFVTRIWPQKDGSLLVITLEGLVQLWPDGRKPAQVVMPKETHGQLLQQDPEGRIYLERDGHWLSFTLGSAPKPVEGWEGLPPMHAFTRLDSGERLGLDTTHLWRQPSPSEPVRMLTAPRYRRGEHPLDVTRDGAGRLWLRTDQRALWQADEGDWRETIFPGSFLSNLSLLDLDQEGWVWHFGQDAVIRVKGKVQKTYPLGNLGGLVNSALVDREGTPWLATNDGLLQILGQSCWELADEASGLPSPLIWDIRRDGLGQLWVQTQTGTAVLRDGAWRTVAQGRMMRAILDEDGSVWFGGNPGDRLHRGNPRTLAIETYPTPLAGNAFIYGLAREPGGAFWLLSNRAHLYRSASGPPFHWELVTPPAGKTPHSFWTLLTLRDGRTALGANGSLFIRNGNSFDEVEGTLPQVPNLVAQDSRGRLVVGYLASQRLTVHESAQGRYRKTGEWSALEGMDSSLLVYALAFDPGDRLWVSTSQGLACLNPDGSRLDWHPTGSGIPSADLNFLALRVEPEGLWVGTTKGLGHFTYPGFRTSVPPPAPHLLELKAQGQPTVDPQLRLPRRGNLLEARFVVPSYLNTATLALEYRLNQGPWKDLESSRIRLESLSAGSYHLEVRGRYRYGQVGPVLDLPFDVRRGWWERLEFYIAAVLLTGLAGLGLARLRQRALVHQNARLQAEVTTRTRELELASQAKSAFLASMSHELRTPLNAILLYSELLGEVARERNDTETITDTDRIARSGKHLLSLLNGIMDLSKIEAGKMHLVEEEVAPGLLVHETAYALQPLAAERGNTLEVQVEPDLPTFISDGTKLRQILINIGGNACKFTEHGTITLRALRSTEGIRFEVEDTGIGLTPEQQKRIFLPYEQAERDTQTKYGGTGLGLTLCLKLANLLQASLWVKSQKGVGTCFFLECPRHNA